MIHTIRVQTTKGPDLLGESILQEIKHFLSLQTILDVRTAKVYRLEGVSEEQAKLMSENVLCEFINQSYTLNKPLFKDAREVVEIAYKPGVMNPEVASILKTAREMGIHLLAADTSHEYAFYTDLKKQDLENIVSKIHLFNPTVEHIVSKTPNTLIIEGSVGKTQIIPLKKMKDKELMDLSDGKLFLNLEEMKVIQAYFRKIKRDPTDCELEILAQTWSEHCVHKTFKARLTIDGKKKKPFIKRIQETVKPNDKRIVSAFVDNSGVINFYDGLAICGKVETHNSPSAIEPYGGAMTGSGGVFRDVLGTGQGAKNLISTDIFCFAPPNLPAKDIPPGCLPPGYLLKKVVQGVRDYGNRVGIPTQNGSIHFHPDFKAKPTVAVGAYGIIPKKYAKKQSPKKDDLVVTLGGRTGRDGIHGATFASAAMTDTTKTVSGSAVQIGNAIEEKRVFDAVLTLRDKGLIRAITDCGAGGYSSAVGEMGKDTGVTVQLKEVPLKYTGLSPWEIFLSESQERMVLAIDPKHKNKVLEICRLFNVEATLIGRFDGSKRLKVFYDTALVCDLPMRFVHEGLPQRHMVGKTKKKAVKEKLPKPPKDLSKMWLHVLSHGNVCSKEAIVRLYDHNVQGRTVLHPFAGVFYDGPQNGSIVKPFYDKPYGLLTTHGLNPILTSIDAYKGSIWAITEAVANYVSIGGDLSQAAFIDNFIWPFPDSQSLADLDKAVDACVTMAKLLNMPFVSGKDSLSSTYTYKNGNILKIPPVLLISVFGKIADVTKTISNDVKKTGSILVLVGRIDTKHLGGSTYFAVTKATSKHVPEVDLKTLPKTLQAITDGIQTGKILSCHDISEGGIAASLAEMCFGGNTGAVIDLSKIDGTRGDFTFFQETAGTFLVEVAREQVARELFSNVPHAIIGTTISDKTLFVRFGAKELARMPLMALKEAWKKPMEEIFA